MKSFKVTYLLTGSEVPHTITVKAEDASAASAYVMRTTINLEQVISSEEVQEIKS